MKYFLTLLILLITSFSFSQKRKSAQGQLLREAPNWAQLMYAESPNVYNVDRAYTAYYKNHPFEKSYHTQYYKYWRRNIDLRIKPDGSISNDEPSYYIEGLSSQNNSVEKSGSWSLIGPMQMQNSNGDVIAQQTNVYSLAQGISNPLVMFCGTENGEIYKSMDGGEIWSNVSYEIFVPTGLFSAGVTALAIDPSDADIVYAGSGDVLFKTINGGSNWTITYSTPVLDANEIIINESNSNIVMVAGATGFHRSADAGVTWVEMFTDASYDIKANPQNPNTLYLIKENGPAKLAEFWRSYDAGQSFQIQTSGWYTSSDPDRNCGGARIAVSLADTNRVYAYLIGESKTDDAGYIGVYRSNDGGSTWTLPNGPDGGPYTATHPNLAIGTSTWVYHQGFYNCAFMASNTNADEILIGGLNLWRSNDGGATFECVNGYECSNYSMHVDMQDFRVFGNEYWVSTDGGIYKSLDFFNTQPEVKMYGVHGADYWGFGQGWNEDVLIGGLYHNGNPTYYENYPAGEFLNIGGGEAPTGYVSPESGRRVYTSDVGSKYLPLNIGDPIASASMGMAPNESYWAANSSEMVFHPNCYNIVFLGNENKLYKSEDAGSSYSEWASFGSIDDKVQAIEISRNNPSVMYVQINPSTGSVGKLHRSNDSGLTWNQLTIPSGSSKQMLLTMNPNDANELWMAYHNGSNGFKIWHTNDGGVTWTNRTTATLNGEYPCSIFHLGNTDGGVYLCSQNTVYYRNNVMTDWVIDNAGLPAVFYTNKAKPFYRDSKIRSASYGKGIWESPFYEAPSGPVATAMVDHFEKWCESDMFYFDDYSMLDHNGASWNWTFPTGTPSTSSARNPSVVFNGLGQHLAILEVTDINSVSDVDSIYVSLTGASANDIQEGFENAFPPAGWQTATTGNLSWGHATAVGGYGTSANSMVADNYNVDGGGTTCDMIAAIDLSAVNSGWLTFDVAYARYSGAYLDSLEVLVSTDCGTTWNTVYFKGDADLATAPDFSSAPFVPMASEWRTDSIDMTGYLGEDFLSIAFRNHGNWSQMLYVDNINLGDQAVAMEASPLKEWISCYPNPVAANGELKISSSTDTPLEFSLFNLNGKLIAHQLINGNDLINIGKLQLSMGTYLYHVKGNSIMRNGKLTVVKTR